MGGDVVSMNDRELERLDVLSRLSRRELRQGRAAELLGVGARQVKRLLRAFRERGARSVASWRRGKASNNRLAADVVGRVEAALRARYPDFGATLASEKLLEHEKIAVSRESVRKIQIRLGLHRPKRRKLKRVFQLRERRPRFGELVQIDASHHDWFEGRAPRCALIVFIDDATGRLTRLVFAPAETRLAYLEALKGHVLAHGRPLAFYADKHGVFHVNAKDPRSGDGKTEFGRVVERLKIELIPAHTPQAKGRVERSNQTLQDRLIKEMRLRGISSMEAARAFAPQFIAFWNGRFAKPSRHAEDAHRKWTRPVEELDEALARREERVLDKALNFSAGGALWCARTEGPGVAMRGAKITLLHYASGEIKARYKDRELRFTRIRDLPTPDPGEDEKTIDARLDAIVASNAQARTDSPPGRGQRAG
jgi:transposase